MVFKNLLVFVETINVNFLKINVKWPSSWYKLSLIPIEMYSYAYNCSDHYVGTGMMRSFLHGDASLMITRTAVWNILWRVVLTVLRISNSSVDQFLYRIYSQSLISIWSFNSLSFKNIVVALSRSVVSSECQHLLLQPFKRRLSILWLLCKNI